MKKSLVIVVVLIAFIGGFITGKITAQADLKTTVNANDQIDQTIEDDEEADTVDKNTEVMEVTLDEMVEVAEANGLKAEQMYLNKRVRVKCIVSDIESSYLNFVSLDKAEVVDICVSNMSAGIEDEYADVVVELEKGQVVYLTGKIEDIMGSYYDIDIDKIEVE